MSLNLGSLCYARGQCSEVTSRWQASPQGRGPHWTSVLGSAVFTKGLKGGDN